MQNQRPESRKFHVLYKTTCSITGKYYIGMHSTNNIDDGYLGSGQLLWKSIKKYGKDSHKFEVLELLQSRQELAEKEKQMITEEMLGDKLCMNLRMGGTGNYPGKPTSEETRAKLSKASKAAIRTPEWRANISKAHKGKKSTPEQVENHRKAMTGFKWSDEAISRRKAGQQKSEKFQDHLSQVKRAVIINDVEYPDVHAAGAALNISPSTLGKRCSSKYHFGFQFKDTTKIQITKIPYGSKPIVIDGFEFTNKSEASKVLKLSIKTIATRLKSDKHPNFCYMDNS